MNTFASRNFIVKSPLELVPVFYVHLQVSAIKELNYFDIKDLEKQIGIK